MVSSLPITESFKPEYLEYYGVLPLELAGGRLRVAVSGTPCAEVLEDLEATFGAPVELVATEADELETAVRAAFASAESTDALVRSLESGEPAELHTLDTLEADARETANQPPVVRYVNLLIREAHAARASDIHVEAAAHGAVVRVRVDGVLTPVTPPPTNIRAAVISRIKLIADLDIAERRAPQDGRIRIRLDERDLDIRVSSVPTLFGESIVLRLLDQGNGPQGLGALGMDEAVRRAFMKMARRPHGIIIATGPTGSGKTTTLYGALELRDATREKIITVEDPVEYRLQGITQVPVNVRAGLTFAAGLRSILRQDPDVIMVGEMRDTETARTAVRAAMTGHLVFSTVHTNDAASAVTRLVDLGVEPYMAAATLQGVLAQRLVRRVCSHCGEWAEDDGSLRLLSPVLEVGQRIRVAEGCALCRQTGYLGRIGLFEFLEVGTAVRSQIALGPEATAIRDIARQEGMRCLLDDGRKKLFEGLTTPEEVLRVVDL